MDVKLLEHVDSLAGTLGDAEPGDIYVLDLTTMARSRISSEAIMPSPSEIDLVIEQVTTAVTSVHGQNIAATEPVVAAPMDRDGLRQQVMEAWPTVFAVAPSQLVRSGSRRHLTEGGIRFVPIPFGQTGAWVTEFADTLRTRLNARNAPGSAWYDRRDAAHLRDQEWGQRVLANQRDHCPLASDEEIDQALLAAQGVDTSTLLVAGRGHA